MVHLDRWELEGLENLCRVKRISQIKPLFFVHRNQGAEHEDSMIVISITAKIKDYLKQRDTGKVVEGSKRWKEVETLWSFTFEEGAWKVADIEANSMSMNYVKMAKELPRIETTLISELRA